VVNSSGATLENIVTPDLTEIEGNRSRAAIIVKNLPNILSREMGKQG
jgi:hypothetical protein